MTVFLRSILDEEPQVVSREDYKSQMRRLNVPDCSCRFRVYTTYHPEPHKHVVIFTEGWKPVKGWQPS
ncbi:hypothetical protein LCGC14_2615990 [marine sediment metagenome]|uniref:Uncharacterized protein n=1 Tax=marine sediment metagenome TaxID=412755 RepID=A0A0F9A4F9_9ZZZZ